MRDLDRRLAALKNAVGGVGLPSRTKEEFYKKWGDPEWRYLFTYCGVHHPILSKYCDHIDPYYKDFDQARYDRAASCVKDYDSIPEVIEENKRILSKYVEEKS